MIVGIAEGQSLKLDTPVLVSDSVNFLTAVFHFSPDWESLPEKWVHFASGGEGCSLQLQEGRITAEMGLNLPAGSWEVYLHGQETDEEGNVLRRATTETASLYVQDFAGFAGEGFPDAPPGLVGQLEQQLEAVRMLAEGHAARHGQGGADALSPEDIGAGRVNPNLMDNWYFVNPVNQRGLTTYAGVAGYSIDRWKKNVSYATTALPGDGVTITNANATGPGAFGHWQVIDNWQALIGETVTFSVLVKSRTGGAVHAFVGGISSGGRAYTENFGSGWGLYSATIQVNSTMDNLNCVIRFVGSDHAEVSVVAAKLELGTQQTLAHQDADGNWVLNEIPDYGEQLLRCQRYQVVYTANASYGAADTFFAPVASIAGSSWVNFLLHPPVPMRAKPAVTYSGLNIKQHGVSGTTAIADGRTLNVISGFQNHVAVSLNAGLALDDAKAYEVTLTAAGSIILDANL